MAEVDCDSIQWIIVPPKPRDGPTVSDHRLGQHSIFTHLSRFDHGLGSDRQLVDFRFWHEPNEVGSSDDVR
jgi:hypothetical protein